MLAPGWSRPLLGYLVVGLWLASAASSHAQSEPPESESPESETSDVDEAEPEPDPSDRPATEDMQLESEARGRFLVAQSLYEQGRFDEAAREFQHAYELSGRPELLYNVYLAQRDAGEIRGAEAALSGYLSEVVDVPNRALLIERRASLREQIAAQDAQETATAEARAAEQRARANERAIERANRTPSRTLPVAFFVAGGAALVAAGVLALNVRSLGSDLEEGCFGEFCPRGLHTSVDQHRRRALATDISLGIGLGSLTAGVLAWVLMKPPDDSDVQASCGPTGCTFSGRF